MFCEVFNMDSEKANTDRVVFCRRCGRPLKGQYSKDLGFGPICYRQWKKERNQQLSLFGTEEDKDGQ